MVPQSYLMSGGMERKLPNSAFKNGVLILIVGPSGAGKDTLLNAAKKRFSNNTRFVFPKRLITRSDQTGEDHIPVSFEEFSELEISDSLFFSWEAHGLQYGITNDVREKLEAGSLILLNMSRRLISEAKERWPHTVVIEVHVEQDKLLQRLQARGREDIEAIQSRLARDVKIRPEDVDHVIDNSGELDAAIKGFLRVLEEYSQSK